MDVLFHVIFWFKVIKIQAKCSWATLIRLRSEADLGWSFHVHKLSDQNIQIWKAEGQNQIATRHTWQKLPTWVESSINRTIDDCGASNSSRTGMGVCQIQQQETQTVVLVFADLASCLHFRALHGRLNSSRFSIGPAFIWCWDSRHKVGLANSLERQKSPMEKSCLGRVFTPFIPSETTCGMYRCEIGTAVWLLSRLWCLGLNNPMSQVEKLVEVKWSAHVAANRTKGSKTFNSAKIQHDANITLFNSFASNQKYLWIKVFVGIFRCISFANVARKTKKLRIRLQGFGGFKTQRFAFVSVWAGTHDIFQRNFFSLWSDSRNLILQFFARQTWIVIHLDIRWSFLIIVDDLWYAIIARSFLR